MYYYVIIDDATTWQVDQILKENFPRLFIARNKAYYWGHPYIECNESQAAKLLELLRGEDIPVLSNYTPEGCTPSFGYQYYTC